MQDHVKPEEEGGTLAAVAQAIADGQPVDWAAAARAVAAEASPRVETMRLIATVAAAFAAHRDLEAAAEPPGASGSGTGPGAMIPGSDDGGRPRDRQVLFTWGPLQVLEHIGRGSFADVYRAYDPKLDREVALKLRRADADKDTHATERFIAEARKLARVKHPNVLVVHGVDVHDGRVGIWTDLIQGKTLAQYVADNGPLGAEEAAHIGLDLACALASLHAHDLVHRDLKPSNVMRQSGGQIVLMDFGSAGDLRPQSSESGLSLFGTPLSMAPEVLLHNEPLRPVHDIYSLGVLLYWLVSRRYPVEARDYHELLAKHSDGLRTPLVEVRPDLSRAFVGVVERAVDPDPARRFATAGQLHHALAEAVAARQSEFAHTRSRTPAWLRWTAGAAAALAVVAFGLWAWSGMLRPVPLQVEATLYRDSNGDTQPLADGSFVAPGDQLFLDIKGNHPMHVWVVDEDAKGDAYALYPLDASGARPLAAGRLHRLPVVNGSVELNWRVSDGAGSETLLLIAAETPLADVERTLASLPRPAENASSGDIANGEPAPQERGMGTLVRRRSHAGVIPELMRGAGLQDGKPGVWVRCVTLKNKGM
jgi:eukaryotic-like serine/threonine-protein kinase